MGFAEYASLQIKNNTLLRLKSKFSDKTFKVRPQGMPKLKLPENRVNRALLLRRKRIQMQIFQLMITIILITIMMIIVLA